MEENTLQSYEMTNKEFTLFKDLVYAETGIHLTEAKRILLISRLSRRLRQLNLKNFSEYYQYLQSSPNSSEEIIQFINRVTTNKTDFYREEHHFTYLRDVVFPAMKRSGLKKIRIWSAGCSTGEEPYTIAMEVFRFFGEFPTEDIKILATDLDTSVLETAQNGVYPAAKAEQIPKALRNQFFTQSDNQYRIHANIQKFVDFKRLNLMLKEFPFTYGFDIIFCRNVIIYFDKEEREELIRRYHRVLRPDGLLFLGHSESLFSQDLGFRSVSNTVYRKV